MGGNKGLKIVHLNIRSILKHRNEVEVTFSDYDIVCLTETWLNGNVENSVIDLPGFIVCRQDRESTVHQVKKRGGWYFSICEAEMGSICHRISQYECRF